MHELSQHVKSIPDVVWQRRPEPHMLSELEEASLAYIYGGAQEILETCSEILGAADPDEFAEELERVARSGDHITGLGMMLAGVTSPRERKSSSDGNWPVVHTALVRALGGRDSAIVFAEGLFLLHQRRRWATAAEERAAPERNNPTTPDPIIWGELFKVDKGDACFAAVLSLLISGQKRPGWMGLLLADGFREGQAAGVRVFASLFSGTEADEALQLCDGERIDWEARWQKAQRVDVNIRALSMGWKDRSKSYSPFGDHSDEEDEYPEDDPDEWVKVGASA